MRTARDTAPHGGRGRPTHCEACARPLKGKSIIAPGGRGVVTVPVCKSPICRLYNQAQ